MDIIIHSWDKYRSAHLMGHNMERIAKAHKGTAGDVRGRQSTAHISIERSIKSS